MNLRLLFDKIKDASIQADPNIGDVLYGDIYQLNHIQTIKYPAIVVTSGQHSADLDDYFFSYRMNIFYVERLLDNQTNKIDIHANAINFLNSLLKHLDDLFIEDGSFPNGLMITNYDIQCFNERFNDMCAGAYVNVIFKVPINECYEIIDVQPAPPAVKNLLDKNYCDKPNGSNNSPSQYLFATYPITENLTNGTRMRFYIKFASNYENKTAISLYNSGLSAQHRLVLNSPIENGIVDVEFNWKEAGDNNLLCVYAVPSSSLLPIPTAEHAELTKV